MGIARFNMSHGDRKANNTMVRKYFQAKKLRPYKTCALMLDLRGRKGTIGNFTRLDLRRNTIRDRQSTQEKSEEGKERGSLLISGSSLTDKKK